MFAPGVLEDGRFQLGGPLDFLSVERAALPTFAPASRRQPEAEGWKKWGYKGLANPLHVKQLTRNIQFASSLSEAESCSAVLGQHLPLPVLPPSLSHACGLGSTLQ